MHFTTRYLVLFTFLTVAMSAQIAHAQADATATRSIDPSLFVGAAGVETGLDTGRNVSVSAGVDLSFYPHYRFKPAIEYRATWAVGKGHVDSLESSVGGIKFSTNVARMVPYADVLAGRVETTYPNGGYRVPGSIIFYTQSASNVFSLGGGTDVVVTQHVSIRFDVQVGRSSSPVTSSGHVDCATAMMGVVYALKLGRGVR